MALLEVVNPVTLETPHGDFVFDPESETDPRGILQRLTRGEQGVRRNVFPRPRETGVKVGAGRRDGVVITATGVLLGSLAARNPLEANLSGALNAMLDEDGALYWTPDGMPALQCTGLRRWEEPSFDGSHPRAMQWSVIAPDPRAYSQTLYQVDVPGPTSGLGGFTSPFTSPITQRASENPGNVTNGGNAPSPPVLQLYGPITSPRVENATVARALHFPGLSIAAGDYLELDVNARTAQLNGLPIGSASRYDFLDSASSRWWDLARGVNTIVLTGSDVDAVNTKLRVRYRYAYAI